MQNMNVRFSCEFIIFSYRHIPFNKLLSAHSHDKQTITEFSYRVTDIKLLIRKLLQSPMKKGTMRYKLLSKNNIKRMLEICSLIDIDPTEAR